MENVELGIERIVARIERKGIETVTLGKPLSPLSDQKENWRNYVEKPLSFEEAVAIVASDHSLDGTRDDIRNQSLKTWAFGSTNGRDMMLAPVPVTGRKRTEPVSLRKTAFSQLCSVHLGVPASYLAGLPAKLQQANMNYALANTPAEAMFRTARREEVEEVRAIVGAGYTDIDDDFYLNIVREYLDRAGYSRDARVRALATGPHTIVRITLPAERLVVRENRIIEAGIDIGNSELGLRSVQVTPVAWDEWCTNGARSWKSEASKRMRHIGNRDRLVETVEDAVPVAFAEARGELKIWERAVDSLVDDAFEEVESLKSFGLTKSDRRAVAKELAGLPAETSVREINEALHSRSTVFDITSAITQAAQNVGSVESRLSLEEVGNHYLKTRVAA